MESDELRTHLHEVERAEASAYVDHRPSPPWFAPAAGLWFGAMAAVQDFHWTEGTDSTVAAVTTLVVVLPLAALIGVYLAWYQRYNGATPRLLGPKPPEIRRAYAAYFAGFLVLLAVVVVVAVVAPWWATGLVTAALVTAGALAYERVYDRAATRVKERLG